MRSDLFPDLFHGACVDDCGPMELTRGERVLLWMLRQWVTARVLDQEPGARLSREAGALVSPRVASAFILMMTTIEGQVRRPLCVAAPCRQGYAEDEQRLITACGVCPASPEIAGWLLEDMVTTPEPVIVAARFLNMALAHEALALPLRFDEPARAPTARPTLH
ncbi:hypothetical protein B7G68_16190 [Caulobacter segnis]|uniref:Uncharacterized protein n=2 Tax=Caulobacter segnis TaxID=88688 RepID=D5VM78_CAUST|nr:hypothetical protein [Caulobacter segnis]ADG11601.1 conserved hypothetical protein [Caulobacter segnis ATCC 21756]AVQ03253.1 hypothetical protein B7G68_16190 [Caulobacter segnis]